MITTGTTSSARKTEVVDVVNGESCADLADLPLENYGAVGGQPPWNTWNKHIIVKIVRF